MKRTVNLQKEINLTAEGKLSGGNCDLVILVEKGKRFSSQKDLAEYLGVHPSAVSNTINGNQRTCKGYHIIDARRGMENMDVILERLSEASADAEAARKWRAYEAEQEAKRIAEQKRQEEARIAKEKHDAAVAKAKEKVARAQGIYDTLTAKCKEAADTLMRAQMELETLEKEV